MSRNNHDSLSELDKTKFIYNAIENGWTVKKVSKKNDGSDQMNDSDQMDVNNQIYEFIKPKSMLNNNEYSLKKYLELFLRNVNE
tara:strand:+ start:4425 stop:4676 length:252 start_codon:yes stop_codon:yes gene_type:complete